MDPIKRIYPDTSVIGGCLDPEFADPSQRLIELVRRGQLILFVSELLLKELEGAPVSVQEIVRSLSPAMMSYVAIDDEIDQLRDAYLRAEILTPKWIDDATHVAAATVVGADAIVSWNFKHIVRLDLMPRYNEVNRALGYGHLNIVTPIEVVHGSTETDNEEF